VADKINENDFFVPQVNEDEFFVQGGEDEFFESESLIPPGTKFEEVKPQQRGGFFAPIPTLVEGLDKAIPEIRGSLGAVEEAFGVPKFTFPRVKTTTEKAITAAARSLFPLPSPDLAEEMVRIMAPISPFEITAEVLSGSLSLIFRNAGKVSRGAKLSKPLGRSAKAISVADPVLTVEEATRKLTQIAEEAAAARPRPIIDVVSSGGGKARDAEFITLMGKMRESVPSTAVNIADPSLEGFQTAGKAMRATVDEAIEAVQNGTVLKRDKMRRLFLDVSHAIRTGQITPTEGGRMLGVQAADDQLRMAAMFEEMSSGSGRMLSQLSRLEREFIKATGNNKAVMDALGKGGMDIPDTYQAAADGWRWIDNIRRAIMTSQFGTFSRNSVSSLNRWNLAIAEDAMSGTLGVLTGKVSPRVAISNVAENGLAMLRLFNPAERKALDKILENFPVEAARLFRTPVMDVSMDQKAVKFINYFNGLQSSFFRRMAFDARLRQTLRLKGSSTLDPGLITKADLADALGHALDMDFANNPTSGAGRAFLKLYDEVPFLTAFGTPFPRFWLNAMRFIWDFSPAPLMSPNTYRIAASADPRIAFGAFNKSLIGTSMIGAGMALDEMGVTGDKWYEVRTGKTTKDGKEEVVDARPFAPFTFPLFLGRFLNRYLKNGDVEYLKLSPEDFSQAFLALRRTDLAAVPLADAMGAKDADGFREKFIRLTKDFLGSFTVGAGTFNDIVSAWDEENALPRSTREGGILAGAQRNIPFLSKDLPVRPAPFRTGPEARADPLIRQFTGLPLRQKTPVEGEADRLNLRFPDIYPRTGNHEYDRVIVEQMGPVAEQILQGLMDSPEYQALSVDEKSGFKKRREIFKRVVNKAREAGKGIASAKRPDLEFDLFIRRSSAFVQEELEALRAELETENAL